MGAPVELTTLANGALTNATSQRKLVKSMYLEPTVDEVAPGVTVFGGDGFLNLTLIEGVDGLIVYDTGEEVADGERFLKQIRRVSDKPIVAILYSHSHYVHGSRQLVGDGKLVAIIGHPNVNQNLAQGAAGTTFSETAPLQTSRVLQQFNHYVPQTGPNAAAGAKISFGKSGQLPVNTPVQDGQCMTIAGIEMQFFTRYGSDTDDCLTVWLPKLGVVLNNLLWPFFPNIYTLRGSKFRDPREWRDGLRTMLALNASVLVNSHARAVKGKEQVRDALEHVIDGLNFVLDQSLRGILKGLGPEDLRQFVRLPAALADHPNLAEIYGEVSHFGPYLHHHAIGWFDGDAATINPLPPREQAQLLVQAMGGTAQVLAQAKGAMAQNQYAWACQLVQYLYLLDSQDEAVRALKADALEAMGRVTPAHTVRSWYMTQAAALRSQINVPRVVFPGPKVLALSSPSQSVNEYRVRLDPTKTPDEVLSLSLSFTDAKLVHGWFLRRGVAHFVEDRVEALQASTVLEVSSEHWLLYFSRRFSLDEFLLHARVLKGDVAAARAFFECFDDLS